MRRPGLYRYLRALRRADERVLRARARSCNATDDLLSSFAGWAVSPDAAGGWTWTAWGTYGSESGSERTRVTAVASAKAAYERVSEDA